jgi:O-antigen/teichoic acid export membrane protein
MPRVGRLAENVLSMTAMRLAVTGLTFVLFWLIARREGSEVLGAYSTVMTVFLFAQQFPLLGLHTLVVRDVATERRASQYSAAAGLAIALPVGMALAAIVMFVGLHSHEGQLQVPMFLVGLSMLPTAVTVVAESVLTGRQELRRIALVNAAEAALRFVITLGLLLGGLGIDAWLSAFLVGRLLAAGAYWQSTLGLAMHRPRRGSLVLVGSYLARAPVFLAILATSAALARMDVMLLSSLATLHEVGQYAVAAKFFEVAMMVSSILVTAVYPMLASVFAAEPTQYRVLVETAARWLPTVGLPLAAAVGLLADPLVRWVFGEAYREAAAIVPLLLFAAVFMALSQVVAASFLVEGAQNLDLVCLAFACAAMVAMLVTWIPAYGALGAGWAIVASQALQAALRVGLLARRFGSAALLCSATEPFAAFALAAGVWWALGDLPPAVRGPACLAAYAGVLWARGLAGPAERARIRVALSARPSQA